MKERYKCAVTIQNEPMFFKRYGENEEEVRKELEAFISVEGARRARRRNRVHQ